MYELTMGDQRYIAESLTTWKMYINPILGTMGEVPQDVEDNINQLAEAYLRDFESFYQEKMNEDETLLSSEVQYAFEQIWIKDHPQMFDIDALLTGCSEEALKQAEKEISDAREAFAK